MIPKPILPIYFTKEITQNKHSYSCYGVLHPNAKHANSLYCLVGFLYVFRSEIMLE